MPTWPELVAEELDRQEQERPLRPVTHVLAERLTNFERQVRFPHTCAGRECSICRWVRTHPEPKS